jgi:hypothetical protein
MLAIYGKKCNLQFFCFDHSSIQTLATCLSRISLIRNSFLLCQNPRAPFSYPASSAQSPGCIRHALNRSTLIDTCVHAYSRQHKFHRAFPYIFGRTVIFQFRMWSPCVSPSPSPFLQPFSIGARTQLVPVVFRVDGAQSRRHCLGCKFFACISIGPERYSMGGTSCRPLSPSPLSARSSYETSTTNACICLLLSG